MPISTVTMVKSVWSLQSLLELAVTLSPLSLLLGKPEQFLTVVPSLPAVSPSPFLFHTMLLSANKNV